MHEQLLELADSPPDLEQYTPYVQYGPPVLIYGVPIKNNYDHERLTLSESLEPKRLRVGTNCFYGFILQPTRLLDKVCSVVTSVPTDHPDCVNMYKKRLAMCELTCDDCWAHLSENIFPIDAENLPLLAINSRYMRIASNMPVQTTRKNFPWYTQHAQMKIFLLK
jgi:hypothetical protein